ncbi:MAG: glycosyltransferase family 2 protein [Dehalococcoidia bacterium]
MSAIQRPEEAAWASRASGPAVSVVLTTRDRPHLLPIALRCFAHQTYPHRELVVVDDGVDHPADVSSLPAESVRIVRVPAGTPLGVKLNYGVDAARGRLCMKMDDDDWYAPEYLATSVDALLESERRVCRPTVVFHMGFLFFELGTWQLHESTPYNAPGATLLFAKDDWRRRPFRPVPTDEDAWFYRDQIRAGATALTIDSRETFIAIRHRGHRGTFGHTWTYQLDGRTLEQYLTSRPLYHRPPEQLIPEWALRVYRGIHNDLAAQRAEVAAAPTDATPPPA